MSYEPIRKDSESFKVRPNLAEYVQGCRKFRWESICQELAVSSGSLNIAQEAVVRHASGPLAGHLAIRWIGKEGRVVDFTYRDLNAATNRFANVLKGLGLGKGDGVFALAGRIPELYIASLGALKNRSVFCPLFSAFGPEPLQQRLSKGDAKVLLTTTRLFRKNIAALRPSLPALKYVLLVDSNVDLEHDVISLSRKMEAASDEFTIPQTDPEASGASSLHQRHHGHSERSNARPSSRAHALHDRKIRPGSSSRRHLLVHGRSGLGDGHVLRHHRAARALGVTNIVDEADFDAERWYRFLSSRRSRYGTPRRPRSAC